MLYGEGFLFEFANEHNIIIMALSASLPKEKRPWRLSFREPLRSLLAELFVITAADLSIVEINLCARQAQQCNDDEVAL